MIHPNSTESLNEQKANGQTTTFRRRVFGMLTGAMTDRQVSKAIGETDLNNIRPEITRLKQDGLVREGGKTKCEWTGRRVRWCQQTGKDYFDREDKPA